MRKDETTVFAKGEENKLKHILLCCVLSSLFYLTVKSETNLANTLASPLVKTPIAP